MPFLYTMLTVHISYVILIYSNGRVEKTLSNSRPTYIQVSQPGIPFQMTAPLCCPPQLGLLVFRYVHKLFTLLLLQLDVYEILFASMATYKYIANIIPTVFYEHVYIFYILIYLIFTKIL